MKEKIKKKKKDTKTPIFFLKEIQELAALLIGLDWDVMQDKQKVIGLEAFSWGKGQSHCQGGVRSLQKFMANSQ